MGNAASHVQHLFYAGATDPRIFNTGVVTPRRMVQSQRHKQSRQSVSDGGDESEPMGRGAG